MTRREAYFTARALKKAYGGDWAIVEKDVGREEMEIVCEVIGAEEIDDYRNDGWTLVDRI